MEVAGDFFFFFLVVTTKGNERGQDNVGDRAFYSIPSIMSDK